ncbi:MAG TPA: phenylacetate--CoA ligase [Phycisphaerae bacterium]|nr:phenylacetate--CoA ligase [Phycisphaerae bacterium]HRY70996.1 phenylacetate--CoA ligase [Phycisphaerae bacterium]HSA29288.1 phenylacetate--CoA ligase [Phycisphaerae bacterium]
MSDRYHNPQLETMSTDEIRSLQDRRLRAITEHVYARNSWFRARLDARSLAPADIRGLADIGRLPTMSKEDFRAGYPLVMSCVDKTAIVEMHMSSGSTGTPVVMPYTRVDIDQWGECMARCYRMAGADPGDIVQITPSFGLFNGGFGFFHGARSMGLFVLPTGAGNTARQLRLANDFGAKVLTGVVSYAIRIMEVLDEEKLPLPPWKVGIFGAECFSDAMKQKVAGGLGIEVFDIYGMTETGGVGTLGMDCRAHDGLHVWEDHYVVEVLARGADQPVADGQMGELVVTSLTREALPVIRFRTGDLTRVLSRQRCACGRTHVRVAPITGRVDDMLIVKGVNFWPRQVEQALMEIPGVRSNYQIVIEEVDGVRDIRVNVEADPGVTGFMVEKHLKEALGFSPKGDVFAPGQLPRQEGKAQRVVFEKK